MLRISLYVAIILLALTNCRRELDAPSWDVDGYVPLASANLRIQDAIADSLKEIGSDQEITLVYKSNLFEYKIDSLIKIPDTSRTESFSIPIGQVNLSPGQVFMADTIENNLNADNAQLRFAVVREGIIELELQSTMNTPTIFTYDIPNATKNGVPFSFIDTLSAGTQQNPTTETRRLDISDYTIDLTGKDNNTTNTFYGVYEIRTAPFGNPITITPADFASLTSTFTGILPEYAKGYFGNRTFEIDETTETDIFKNFKSGLLSPAEGRLNLRIKNEAGVDFGVDLKTVAGANTNTGQSVNLDHFVTQNNVKLSRSLESGSGYPPIRPSNYNAVINEQNSNLPEFIGVLPKEFKLVGEVELNPLGNISSGNDFAYFGTGFEMNIDAEIPLRFNAQNLIFQDTTEFSIDSDSKEDTKRINGGYLLVHCFNLYPIEGELQGYFMDSTNTIVDSLFTEDLGYLSGGIINNDQNRVTNRSESTIRVPLTPQKIDNLYEASKIWFNAKLNTTNQPDSLTFYDNYDLNIKLVGDFNYQLEADL
ncbi:hypothetical protein [Salibacter sp.]|uniref:hypothetical protein n=1 Tax=Salibacter sp. TaxID=2010995 RepID=UPI0028707595|nr:hypothetical protein [Salibacter sp.]MDR9487327.1 hypothetical protein [Salibacter sp.]